MSRSWKKNAQRVSWQKKGGYILLLLFVAAGLIFLCGGAGNPGQRDTGGSRDPGAPIEGEDAGTGDLLRASLGGDILKSNVKFKEHQVILVLVNGLSFQDIREHAAWSKLAREAYIAGTNLNTAAGRQDIHNYVTLGAGQRALGLREAGGFEVGETIRAEDGQTAADVYLQRTGREVSTGVLVHELPRLVEKNNGFGSGYVARPGALGEAITDVGGWTAVYGNSDRGEEAKRLAPLVSMNEAGITTTGEVGEVTLKHASDRPYGVTSNYKLIEERIRHLPHQVKLAVVEAGDLDRFYAQMSRMDVGYARQVKEEILQEIAAFVNDLRSGLQAGQVLMVYSPMVDRESYKQGEWLSPLLWFSDEQEEPGLLMSASTRRAGVITNVDIPASILQWLGLAMPQDWSGHPAEVVPGETEQAHFWPELGHMTWVHRERGHVLTPFLSYQMVVLFTAALVGVFRISRLYPAMRVLSLALLFAPALFLILSGIEVPAWLMVGFLWGGTLLISWLVCSFFSMGVALVIAGVCGWLPVVFDLLRKGVWMRQSLLGYDPMIGARFYGIGNEYMGVVLGSAILVVAVIWQMMKERKGRVSINGRLNRLVNEYPFRRVKGKERRIRLSVQSARQGEREGREKFQWHVWDVLFAIGSALFFFWLLLIFVLPDLGANAGGALSVAAGFTVSWYLLFRQGVLNLRTLFFTAFALFFVLLLMAGLNPGDAPSASHVGQALGLLQAGEWEELKALALRKWEMNWRLMRISIWSKTFVTSLLIGLVFALLYRPSSRNPDRGRDAELYQGFTGILVGSVTALLLNDSGVVAAATSVIYMVVPLIMLSLSPPSASMTSRVMPVDGKAR